MDITTTSTTDSPSEVQAALESIGQEVQSLDVRSNEPEIVSEPSSDAPAAETAESKTAVESETPEEVQESEAEPEPVKEKGVQKRIDKLTRERYERDGRIASQTEQILKLEKQLAEAGKAAPAPVVEPDEDEPEVVAHSPIVGEEPQQSDFDDYAEFTKAQIKWENSQTETKLLARIDELQAKIETKTAETAAKAAVEALADEWGKRCQAVSSEYPDWDEKGKAASALPFNSVVSDVLFESEVGPHVLYYLASNPDVAQKLYDLTNYGDKASATEILKANRVAGKEVARIESLIAKQKAAPESEADPAPAKPKPVTSAPAPIRAPKGAAAPGGKSPYDGTMSTAEYQTWRESHPRG